MKKFSKLLFFLFLTINTLQSFAQGGEDVEMADAFRADGKIYYVIAGVAVILIAIVLLLVVIDRKVFRLEKRVEKEIGE